jgi:hypothetical protein
MAKTYRRNKYKRTQKQTRRRRPRTQRRRKQKRGGAQPTQPTQPTQTKVPSILLVPYRHSGEECIKKMIEATPPGELTLKQNPAILNTYAMLLLTTPNSMTYRNKMKPDVKAFIDDINKRRLLEYQLQHSKSTGDLKNMPQSVKGDLRQLNAAYVAEILSPDVNKNATIQDIIDWLTK